MTFPLCGGCASTIDTVTGQRFKESPFTTMFSSDDPIEVLRTSKEGDLRAKAMLEVKEPKQRGGTEEQQFEVLQILATSATSDRQSICRLHAIETLGRFEDPRASQILLTAYQTAAKEPPAETPTTEAGVMQAGRRTRMGFTPVSSFTAETVASIQCRALESLAKKRTPEALALLCEVAMKPAKREMKTSDFDAMTPPTSGIEAFDLRLAAIRSLASFKGEGAAAHVLYTVMTSEHDPALCNRAHLALMEVTGQNYGPKAQEWRAYLKINDKPVAKVQPVPVAAAAP